MSELNIKGGGIINSPDALTLVGKDGSIDIQGGTMTLRATTIVLDAKNIKIIGHGETKVEGHPIRLN